MAGKLNCVHGEIWNSRACSVLTTHSLTYSYAVFAGRQGAFPSDKLPACGLSVVKMLQEMCKPKQIRTPSQHPVAWAKNMCLREGHLPGVNSKLIPCLFRLRRSFARVLLLSQFPGVSSKSTPKG